MKKRSLTSLKLNKKSVSNLNQIEGGTPFPSHACTSCKTASCATECNVFCPE